MINLEAGQKQMIRDLKKEIVGTTGEARKEIKNKIETLQGSIEDARSARVHAYLEGMEL